MINSSMKTEHLWTKTKLIFYVRFIQKLHLYTYVKQFYGMEASLTLLSLLFRALKYARVYSSMSFFYHHTSSLKE